jgi:hypothetical protein
MILQMVEAIEQQGPLSPRIACLSSKNFLNNVQGLGRIFCQRDYGPLLDHIKGPF